MDKRILVADGHTLLRLLDKSIAPRGAIWANNPDAERWELWILPAKGVDLLSFTRAVSDARFRHRDQFIEMGESTAPMITRLLTDDHPIARALNSLYWLEGEGAHIVGSRMLDIYYVIDAILLRWTTEEAASEAAFELH